MAALPCHVLFKVKELMHVSEQDAADLVSEVLLDNKALNDEFISMVEEIHMKARMMGNIFAIKTRGAKKQHPFATSILISGTHSAS